MREMFKTLSNSGRSGDFKLVKINILIFALPDDRIQVRRVFTQRQNSGVAKGQQSFTIQGRFVMHLGPVVQSVDNAFYWINPFLLEKP